MTAGPVFLLGLPTLADNALWRTALRLGAPVLISANALSLWQTDPRHGRSWRGFARRSLHLVARHPVALDSGGFVAAARYRGFPWCVERYLDLCAAAPFLWFAAQDLCVEPELAPDEAAVLDRISGTVRLNLLCRLGAERRGIADRLVPVLQGWRPEHYLRCLDRMAWAADAPLLGVGSMCRRHAQGPDGALRVVDELDRALAGSPARLHLFGLKSGAMAALRGHPRIASFDSQAYGLAARRDAYEQRASKTNAVLAARMGRWLAGQRAALAAPGWRMPHIPDVPPPEVPAGDIERRVAAAAEELRRLHEAGEADWTDVSPLRAWAWAGMEEETEDPEDDKDGSTAAAPPATGIAGGVRDCGALVDVIL